MALIRCFIALEPDDAARGDLRDVAESLDMTGWRPTPAGQYHVTLKFMGDVDPDELSAVRQAVAGACEGIGTITLCGSRVRLIPNARRPRVLAAMFEPHPMLRELVERLELAMADLGFAMEGRAYRPHVTLGRRSRSGPRPACCENPSSIDHIAFDASQVTLFQSILTDRGAVYQVLDRFGLNMKA